MTKNIIVLLLVLVGFDLTQTHAHEGHAVSQQDRFTKHFRETIFSITEKGHFSVEILPDEKEYKIGKNVTGLVIHDRHDEDVEAAAIEIEAEGLRGPIEVTDKGNGLYTVSGLDLKREGTWTLIVRIRNKSISDQAVFTFPEISRKSLPPGSYNRDGLK